MLRVPKIILGLLPTLSPRIENLSSSAWPERFLQFVAIVCPSGGLSKYIETKVHITCFTEGYN